jgi:hypothetical protein
MDERQPGPVCRTRMKFARYLADSSFSAIRKPPGAGIFGAASRHPDLVNSGILKFYTEKKIYFKLTEATKKTKKRF